MIGQIAVTQAFLPLLRRGRGRIVNMGSIAGRGTIPLLGPYSASRFALQAATDASRTELEPGDSGLRLSNQGRLYVFFGRNGSRRRAGNFEASAAARGEGLDGEAVSRLREVVAEWSNE